MNFKSFHKKKIRSKAFYLKYGPDLYFDEKNKVRTPKPEKYIMPNIIQNNSHNFEDTLKKACLILCLSIVIEIMYLAITLAVHLKSENNSSEYDTFYPDYVPDYALSSAGATILGQPNAPQYDSRLLKLSLFTLVGWPFEPELTTPTSILKPWRTPGECWAFAGSEATIFIRLSHTIIPKAVTIDHIPREISPTGHIASAPNKFSIHAIEEEADIGESLGTFNYLSDGEGTQSFILDHTSFPVNIIKFTIHSNHGHHLYTCVYKIRIHGDVQYV